MSNNEPQERVEDANYTYFTVFSNDITKNEIHSVIIGVGMGVFAITIEGFAVILAGIGYSIFGRRFLNRYWDDYDTSTIALKTIKFEPWYFIFATVLTVVIVRLTLILT